MEKYKKKSLNFMGYSRELRKTERENQRYASRQERFSIIRMLENESITEEKTDISSRIPKIGIPKDQATSRVEMLQKWKQEKIVKKQQESKLKKPAFKVGVIKPNPPSSLGSKPLFALNNSSRLYKSSFQVSNSQLSSKRQESFNVSNTKTNAKVSNSQASAKKLEVNTVNIKAGAKDMKIQSSTSKTVAVSKPESKWPRNKESCIQSLNMKPKVDPKSNIINKDQVSSHKKLPTIGSKPPVETKKIDQVSSNKKQPTTGSKPPVETKKIESRLKPLNVRSKVTSLARDAKSNIPSSGLPKASVSKTLSKEPKQIPSVLPKVTRTLSTESKQVIPKKNDAVKSIPKFPRSVAPQKKGNLAEKTTRSESKDPKKPESDHLTNKPDEVAAFECELSHIEPVEVEGKSFAPKGFVFQPPEFELSHIEPVKDKRKSFAPEGFMFRPPVELNSSLFLEDGPAAIFMRVKNKYLRTSTPKQSPSQKCSLEIEDSKCLKNEDTNSEMDETIQCPKDEKKNEDAQCSKNADINLGSLHKYEALLSSLESVDLNDAKPIDCKQSLKFEFPEVVSTQKESSKITHPELSIDTESGTINPPFLPHSVEIDKTEINSSANTKPTDDKITAPFPGVDSVLSQVIPNQTHIVEPIVCKQSHKFEFPEIVPTQNEEEVLLSSNIMCPENLLAGKPTPNGAMDLPILPDSSQVDKTEINSIDPKGDNKINAPFLKVDPVIAEGISSIEPDENMENDQSVTNGFLQKQGNGLLKFPERKIRNFRQSEKPVLSSISESLENTPRSALKKKVLDSVFTPRRSLRLAKLSGNFSSLENLLDIPKPKEMNDKAVKVDFTPRRSLRLSKFSTEFSSAENLFDVRRPTLYGTPEEDKAVPKINSRVTYDFDRLSSETEEDIHPRNTRGGKVSLLYTPPNLSRPSIMRHSIRGDLMSFSPNT